MKPLSNRATGMNNTQLSRAIGAAIPNFDAESKMNQVFKITLNNTTENDAIIVLHPGSLATTAEIAAVLGVTPTAIAKTGTIITGITCSTKTSTLLEFLQRYATKNPIRITRIQVEVSNELQLNEDLVFASISPFGKVPEIAINPAIARKETNNQSKLVTLTPSNAQLDDQTVWYVKLLAGTTLNLNLAMGISSNAAAILAEQAKIASQY